MRGIALVSYSRDPAITRAVLEQIAAALTTQLLEHYASFWQAAGVGVDVFDMGDELPGDVAPMLIFDSADQAGDLGYHSRTPDGSPYARVFWEPIKAAGGRLTDGDGDMSLSVTCSHEALEMIADPYANGWHDEAANTQVADEICDPVQADAYEIHGVSVSNFVGPRWFRPGAGPYDWISAVSGDWSITAPFTRRPGGYIIQRQGGTVSFVGMTELPPWKQRTKEHPASRSARRAKLYGAQ